jgi:hypothetical protein
MLAMAAPNSDGTPLNPCPLDPTRIGLASAAKDCAIFPFSTWNVSIANSYELSQFHAV